MALCTNILVTDKKIIKIVNYDTEYTRVGTTYRSLVSANKKWRLIDVLRETNASRPLAS